MWWRLPKSVPENPTICMVGNFPPAAGGQALVNEFFFILLSSMGARVSAVNISPLSGPLTWYRRVARLPRAVAGLCRLVYMQSRRRATSVYLGVSGGYGQLYDIAFAGIARLGGSRLFLHHDSYAYLERRKALTAALVSVAGSDAVHIVLCDDMAKRLTLTYPSASKLAVVSNATNADDPASAPPRKELQAIGFIGFLSRAKGVIEFLDVAESVHRSRPSLRVLLAGPIVDPSIELTLKARLHNTQLVEYLGEVHGRDKSDFFNQLDVLVFPTRYVNEADPKVVTEALAHGTAVIALDRGCIGSTLVGGGGVCISPSENFREVATELILHWTSNAEAFSAISAGALANYRALRTKYDHELSLVSRAMLADR